MKTFYSYSNIISTNANFNNQAKLATLYFDELILQAPSCDHMSIIEEMAEREKWKPDTYKEMKKIQVPSLKYLPSVKPISIELNKPEKENIFELAVSAMKDKYGEELRNPDTYSGAMHESIMGGAGIANEVYYWSLLNAKCGCSMQMLDVEAVVARKLFKIDDTHVFCNRKV